MPLSLYFPLHRSSPQSYLPIRFSQVAARGAGLSQPGSAEEFQFLATQGPPTPFILDPKSWTLCLKAQGFGVQRLGFMGHGCKGALLRV